MKHAHHTSLFLKSAICIEHRSLDLKLYLENGEDSANMSSKKHDFGIKSIMAIYNR